MSDPSTVSIQAHQRVTLVVDGRDYGVFDTAPAPDLGSTVSTHRPGGEIHERPVAGLPSAGTVNLSRGYARARDADLLQHALRRRGWGPATLTYYDTDPEMNPIGRPRQHKGILQNAQAPDYDSNSSDPGQFRLTLSVGSEVT